MFASLLFNKKKFHKKIRYKKGNETYYFLYRRLRVKKRFLATKIVDDDEFVLRDKVSDIYFSPTMLICLSKNALVSVAASLSIL